MSVPMLKKRARARLSPMILLCHLLVLSLALSFSVEAAPVGGEISRVVYEYVVSYSLVNRGSATVFFKAGLNDLRLPLALNIEGWQEVTSYQVLLNNVEATDSFDLVKDEDGNNFLVSRENLALKGGRTLKLRLIQLIEVYWAPLNLGFLRRNPRIEGSSSEFSEIPRELSVYSNISEPWGDVEGDTFEEVILQLKRDGGTVEECVLNTVKWVMDNIRYTNKSVGVKHPSVTLSSHEGSCGDQSALIVALLRSMGIPCYMKIAIVNSPSYSVLINSGGIKVSYSGYVPHAFVMAYIPKEGWVPIDVTFRSEGRVGDPLYAVNKAGVSVTDDVIVMQRAVKRDPNLYLMITSPSVNSDMVVEMTLEEVRSPMQALMMVVIILFLIVLSAYLVLKEMRS